MRTAYTSVQPVSVSGTASTINLANNSTQRFNVSFTVPVVTTNLTVKITDVDGSTIYSQTWTSGFTLTANFVRWGSITLSDTSYTYSINVFTKEINLDNNSSDDAEARAQEFVSIVPLSASSASAAIFESPFVLLYTDGTYYYTKDPTTGVVTKQSSTTTAGFAEAITAAGSSYPIQAVGTFSPTATFTIPDKTTIYMPPGSIINVPAAIQIGSKTAVSKIINVTLNVQPAAGYSDSSNRLVKVYNVQSNNSNISVNVPTDTAVTQDAVAIYSTNGKGVADVVFNVNCSGSGQVHNGIVLMNGDEGIASVAGDFVNGNLFVKANVAATNDCVELYPTGSFAGSVSGKIANNVWLRSDLFGFTTGLAVVSKTTGSGGNNAFLFCTFEAGTGPTYEVDLKTAAMVDGQMFIYCVTSHAFAAQLLPANGNDVWLSPSSFTLQQWHLQNTGIAANSLQITNKVQSINQTYAGTTSTTYVSSGIGLSRTPSQITGLKVSTFTRAATNTAADGVKVAIYRNTTGIPAGGTAVGTDTKVWEGPTFTGITGSLANNWSVEYNDTGLVLGTPYYYYIAIAAITGGTASVVDASMRLEES